MAVQYTDSSNESRNEYYRVASSIELGFHNLMYMSQAFAFNLCSEEAVLQAAGDGNIEKLRELNEKGTNFRVTDTVSMELYVNCYYARGNYTCPRPLNIAHMAMDT